MQTKNSCEMLVVEFRPKCLMCHSQTFTHLLHFRSVWKVACRQLRHIMFGCSHQMASCTLYMLNLIYRFRTCWTLQIPGPECMSWMSDMFKTDLSRALHQFEMCAALFQNTPTCVFIHIWYKLKRIHAANKRGNYIEFIILCSWNKDLRDFRDLFD